MRVNILRPFPLVEIRRCHDCDPDDPVLHLESRTEANQWVRLALGDPHAMEELRELMEGLPEGKAVPRLDDQDLIAAVVNAVMDGRLCLLTSHAHAGMAPVSMEEDEEEADEERPIPPAEREKVLELVSCDDHFAPTRETQDIDYRLQGYQAADAVTLEITSPHYDDPLVRRELTSGQKSDGNHTFHWNGRIEQGDQQDQFAHPLLAPFRVRLFDAEGREGTCEFKVLWAAIRLHDGPWTPRDDVPTRADREDHWVQLRLNELGWFGGPVDGDIDDIAERAIVRYKSYHRQLAADDSDDVTEDLCDRLEAGDNARQVFTEARWVEDEARESRVQLDADVYYEEYNDLLDPDDKVDDEEDKLSRPCFALRAEVLLLRKGKELGQDDCTVAAPRAVGPVKVRWLTEDPMEDLTHLPDGSNAAVPSRTRQYMQAALAVVGPPGDNCPEDYDGLRELDDGHLDHRPYFYEDELGLLPFEAEEDDDNLTYTTRAHHDFDNPHDLLGCAMILARPSYMSGDSYRFGVTLDFEDEDNQAYLEGIYGDDVPRARTGTLTVWRRARVAAYVAWAQRNEANEALSWANVHDRFEEAFIDLFTPTRTLGRDDFMDLAAYNTIVQADCNNAAYRTAVQNEATTVAGGGAAALDLDHYAVDYRTAQLPGESLNTYGQRIGNTAASIWDDINEAIVERLSDQLRPRHPQGLLVLDFKAICPTQWRNVSGTNTDVPASRSAWADRNGVTMIEVDINMNQDTLMAHEIGHNFYLSHWEVPAGDHFRRPDDHDRNDHNCMMSYAWNLTGRTDNVNNNGQLFDGRFCGKCNLKLRGWNIGESGLPAQS
jgi:hypothetical protein